MTTADRPAWATRIVRERQARGWSQADLARALRMNANSPNKTVKLPHDDDSLMRSIKRWERGTNKPDQVNSELIAQTFNTVTDAFFPPESPTRQSAPEVDTLEIVSRLQRADINTATLEHLRHRVDDLCCRYPYVSGTELAAEGGDLLSQVTSMFDRLTGRTLTEAKSLAGWLCLLVGCCEYDIGHPAMAKVLRDTAEKLGTEIGDHDILGWAHEMIAWFALTGSNYRGVVSAAQAGVRVAAHRSVSVQLHAQEAKAWARVGDRHKVEIALDKGRTLLEDMRYPDDPSHHFVVDPSKFDFYAMDCYRILGENQLANAYAEEVLQSGTDFSGFEKSTMRNAEARITLGVVAAREGEIERAVGYGHQALNGDRQSLPSLLMVSRELSGALTSHEGDPEVRGYLERLRALQAS